MPSRKESFLDVNATEIAEIYTSGDPARIKGVNQWIAYCAWLDERDAYYDDLNRKGRTV